MKGKTKAELISIIEAQGDEVRRARRAKSDLHREQARRKSAEARIAELESMPAKVVEKPVEKIVTRIVEKPVEVVKKIEVPTPDPKQESEIKRLRAKLDAMPKRDIRKAERFEAALENMNARNKPPHNGLR